MKHAATAALVVLLTASLWAQPASSRLSADGHTLTLYGEGGVPVASIQHRSSTSGPTPTDQFDVRFEARYRYQFATESAPGYARGTAVRIAYLDMDARELKERAAEREGWRDLSRRFDYWISVTSFAGLPRPDGQNFVAVLTNPSRSGFLVALITVTKPTNQTEEGVSP